GLADAGILERERRQRAELADRPSDTAQDKENPAVRTNECEDDSDRRGGREEPNPDATVRLERHGGVREDPRSTGERTHEASRQIIDAALEVDRVVAHVRGRMEADDAEGREEKRGEVEHLSAVPGD